MYAVIPNSVKVFAWLMPLVFQVHHAGIPAQSVVDMLNEIWKSRLATDGMAWNEGPIQGRRIRRYVWSGRKKERPGKTKRFFFAGGLY